MKSVYNIISSHTKNIHSNIFDEINHRNLCYGIWYILTDTNPMQKDIPLLITQTLEMSDMTGKIEGYVIVQPGKNAWQLSGKSFDTSVRGAWMRHIGGWKNRDIGDEAIIIQRWQDKGYRVKKATLVIDDVEK